MAKKKTAYEEAMEETKEFMTKREAFKGKLLGKIDVEDAVDMLIEHLRDADTEEVMDLLEIAFGVYIEHSKVLKKDIGTVYLDVFKTPNYMGFFDGKLKK